MRKYTPNCLKRWTKALFARFGLAIHQTEPTLFDFLGNQPIQTLLDAGAYVGDFAKQIRKLHPGATIYAFEPNPSQYSSLTREMSGDSLFQAYRIALAAGEGFRDFHIMSGQYASSLLALHPKRSYVIEMEETGTISVPTTSLDSWAKDKEMRQPILLKADVQGMEAELIKGGPSTLAKVSIVVMEVSFQPCYVGQPLFEDIYDLMSEQGFRLRGYYGIYANRTTKEQLWGDALFIK